MLIISHIIDNFVMPRYSWNTAKVGVKHQSINQSINTVVSSLFKIGKPGL